MLKLASMLNETQWLKKKIVDIFKMNFKYITATHFHHNKTLGLLLWWLDFNKIKVTVIYFLVLCSKAAMV